MIDRRTRDTVLRGHVREVVQSLLRRSLKQSELRGSDRFPLSMMLRAYRLDNRKQSTGEEIELLTRDISDTGIGIVSTFPIDDRFLLLRIPMERQEWCVVAEVQWRHQMSNSSFHRLGASFVVDK